MPCLSPILSQSVSDNHDESSRGRPSSRWWEVDSANGGGRADGGQTDKRTRRESKYMGLPREQWAEQWVDAKEEKAQLRRAYEAAERNLNPWGAAGASASASSTTTSLTPSAPPNRHDGLDVSRLVSLPPPYPRHHPAVSNSHPELADTRVAVRTASDISAVDQAKEKFASSSRAARQAAEQAALERKQAFRRRVQADVSSAAIGFAEAAAREAEFEKGERDRAKDAAKADFTDFQAQVVSPLHEMLTSRIGKVTDLFEGLASQLFDSVGVRPDVLQEEGDDKPELLERLTLLKWVFEARETLHKAVFDLLSDRNDRYRDVILTPYRLAGNAEKLASAGAFFAEDARKRQCEFDEAVHTRVAEFKAIVEQTATKGVEAQMSAFWDLVPALGGLLEQIPQRDVGRLAVQIPASEMAENPAYRDHPLQYLYSLVQHAHRSMHQFIEAQTNLLCLLHEVKEAEVYARGRVEGERFNVDGEQRVLTDELKDKVHEVQEQWTSALGRGFEGVRGRVKDWLVGTGGWDEAFEEEDAGPAGGVV
jgi:hypothetical protein